MSNTGAMIGGVIAARRRKLIQKFRAAGATSPSTAMPLPSDAIFTSFIFKRLHNFGVLKETTNGRYYLDEAAEKALSKQRRIMLMVLLVIVLALVAIIWMTNK